MQARHKISRLLFLFFTIATSCSHITINGETNVFFSPEDRPQKHLINYIKNAQKRIYVAIYMFTDKKIAEALIEAQKRNVDVQVIYDKTSSNSKYGKISLLKENKIKTFVFDPRKQKSRNSSYSWYGPLMHNKFAIIDDNVWTGSFNWTLSANNRNQENVIWTDEKQVCEKYLANFEKLKSCLCSADHEK